MELMNSLMTFFGISALPPEATFVEFIQWFVQMVLAVVIVVKIITTILQTAWRMERSSRL